MIRLYGHPSGSFRSVSIGMRDALEHHNALSGFVSGDDFGERVSGGLEAPFSITIGAPNRVLSPHLQGKHSSHWLLLAPNSQGVPKAIKEMILSDCYDALVSGVRKALDGLLAPSAFAESVLRAEFPQLPVILWQHGIGKHFRVQKALRQSVREQYERDDPFRMCHITSTRHNRKGTRELFVAWKRFLEKHPKAILDVIVNPSFYVETADLIQREQARHVRLIPGQNFSEKRYVEGISMYHGIIQPSRAEGFGLVPLEALACGVPVILTEGTGHLDYCEEVSGVRIPVGSLEESDDFWGAQAPSVDPEEIYLGMLAFQESWDLLQRQALERAEEIQASWSWEARAVPALQKLKELE